MEPYAPWKVVVQIILVPAAVTFFCLRNSPLLKIVALSICAMVVYGMVQDQVSVRLSKEYFTLAHPPIEGIDDPTVLGILWGFLGSWWGGLIVGISAGFTATAGAKPILTWRMLFLPILLMVLGMACVTLIAGLSGYYNARLLDIRIGSNHAIGLPADDHTLIFAVACGHFGTYSSAFVGSAVLCIWIAWKRHQLGQAKDNN